MSVIKPKPFIQADFDSVPHMQQLFEQQKQVFRKNPAPDYKERIKRIDLLKEVILAHKNQIVDAICQDFGSRSRPETLLSELTTTLSQIRYTKKNLKRWLCPQKRHLAFHHLPGSAKVMYQPKGVIGIISPWNYPFFLTAVPLLSALAAGNRVMIKPSELTPRTSLLIKELFASIYDYDLVYVVLGGPELGKAFSQLPWDHLFFTGSTRLGKVIMGAAAENCTPVTLELGGKSPLIIHPDYPLQRAIKRIIYGKFLNGGQTCVAPDYILLPNNSITTFVNKFKVAITKAFPTIYDNPDYSSIINKRHYDRLKNYIQDAIDKGAYVIEINPSQEDHPEGSYKIPPTLILNTTDDMLVRQEEIFGPLLPLIPYNNGIDEALDFVNQQPHPLALYYFDDDTKRSNHVLEQTLSGNACINDSLIHVSIDDLPFGGVGHSGMGAYHGQDGFETFSHKKGILIRGKFHSANVLLPPYGKVLNWVNKFLLR